MADRLDPELEPEDPALSVAARHALHDEELIAAFATDGDAADDPARARSLIERCTTCRDLHADLVAIGGSLRAAGTAATTASPERAPRDFRLSVETANRLRPGSVVIRLRDRIREGIAAFSRPVGMSMASLGIVGLLLGTLTLGGIAGPVAAPADMGGSGAGQPTGEAFQGSPPTTDIAGAAGSPRETLRLASVQVDSSKAPPTGAPTAAPATSEAGAPGDGGRSSGMTTLSAVIVGGSAILLIGGVALLVLGPRQRREPIPGR